MVDIFHYADMQVVDRETKEIGSSYIANFSNIENEIIERKSPVVLIAGDLFEFANATDSERTIIYTHLCNILRIETVKELVFMSGNHDLPKSDKVTSNMIDTFSKIMETLTVDLSSKVIYLKDTKVYDSKNFNIQYVAFSLEDKLRQPNMEDVNPHNKFQISVYHDILIDYVDEVALPITDKVRKRLYSLAEFPTKYVIAGDIHKLWNFAIPSIDNDNFKIFNYSGSTHQRNHGEGSKITIRNKTKVDVADTKYCIIHHVPETNDCKQEDITTSLVELECYTAYTTIDLNTTTVVEDFENQVSRIKSLPKGKIFNFVKVVASTAYIPHEMTIRKIILDYMPNADIDYKYDKVISKNTEVSNVLGAEYLQQIMDEKSETITEIDESGNEVVVERKEFEINENNLTEVFDNIVLTKDKLTTLFDSCIERNRPALVKEINDEKLLNDVINDIRILFTEQIEHSFGSGNTYTIELDSIEGYGFMSLAKNRIDLSIIGLVRILASNGVGKTTLYSWIRWVITGKVFDSLKDNQKTINDLMVFNDEQIQDTVFTKLAFKVNGSQIYLTRWVERKWKSTTTEFEKTTVGWRNHVTGTSRFVKLEVVKNDGSIVERTGDDAEKLLQLWFGDVLNIAIFDQFKIKQMLNSKTEDLGELVLNYIGVDYLQALKNNLPTVKERYELQKPKQTKTEIIVEISNTSDKIDTLKSKIAENESMLQSIANNMADAEVEVQRYTDELVNIGNIPQMLKDAETHKQTCKNEVDTFVPRQVMDVPTFEQVEPIKPQLIDNTELKDATTVLSQKIVTEDQRLKDEKLAIIEANGIKITKLSNHLDARFEIIKNEYVQKAIEVRDAFRQNNQLEIDALQVKITTFDITAENERIAQQNLQNSLATSKIAQLEADIKSGYCSECKRPLDNFEHTAELKRAEIETLRQSIVEIDFTELLRLKAEIKKCEDNIQAINAREIGDVYEQYRNIANQANSKNVSYFDGVQFEENLLQFKVAIDDFSKAPVVDETTYNELSIEFDKHVCKLDENKKSNQEMLDKYNDEFTTYNNAYSKYNVDLMNVNMYNSSINEHNNKYLLLVDKLTLASKQVTEISEQVAEYDAINERLNEAKSKLQAMETYYNENANTTHKFDLGVLETKLAESNQKFQDFLKYQRDLATYNIYKKIIEKDFKDVVFGYYRNFLNITFNLLLSELNFKLIWHESGELFYYTVKNGREVYRNVQSVSGMETCFLGLSLLYAIHTLNVRYNISHIFIDEISGQLNSGKGIKDTKAVDYQHQLLLLLAKFKDKKIFIVDHVIQNMYQTATYVVTPTEQGAIYTLED